MGHFSEHGGVPYEPPKKETPQETLDRVNQEREKKGLPRLSYFCVAHGMPPTTYQGGED